MNSHFFEIACVPGSRVSRSRDTASIGNYWASAAAHWSTEVKNAIQRSKMAHPRDRSTLLFVATLAVGARADYIGSSLYLNTGRWQFADFLRILACFRHYSTLSLQISSVLFHLFISPCALLSVQDAPELLLSLRTL